MPDARAPRPPAGGIVPRPDLFERLGTPALVTVVSAPPGSGKTLLLRSWIGAARLTDRTAWVAVGSRERDSQGFWVSVVGALRQTAPGSALVHPLTAAPDLDGWAVVERLLKDLAPLEDPIWLVIDDAHELAADESLRQLELLLMRAPTNVRFVLATRHDLRLGLHRLRLEGELTEIRAPDLRFSLAESRELLTAAGVELTEPALRMLYERTEGWAAGLRLAALSLARRPDPERFAAEFSGSERTVAEYLLAEVLDRQPEEVRRLLLRTSILEQVSGELADLLTGSVGGERVLQDLEEANAFVVSLDAERSRFRYHHLFAGLLQLQLRRTAPDDVSGLHRTASQWLAEHGYPVEAIRHAEAAQAWTVAARLLADHSHAITLDGQGGCVHELIAAFPAGAVAADAELAAQLAEDELLRGSLEAAERHLAAAVRGSASVAGDRREAFQLQLAYLRMAVAQERGDLPTVVKEVEPLLAGEAGGDDLRGMALTRLGVAELWALRADDAERHLEQAVTLARQIERPWLEVRARAHWAFAGTFQSAALAIERATQAIDLAAVHGWNDEPVIAVAYATLCLMRTWQLRLEEAETLLDRAESASRTETEPAVEMMVRHARGMVERARGRDAESLAAFEAAERPARLLLTAHPRPVMMRAQILQTLVRLGQTERAEQTLAGLDEQQRDRDAVRVAAATMRLATNDPQAAVTVLAPILEGSAQITNVAWRCQAVVLEAIAQDALGASDAAERALEHGLDLAERDGLLLPFLLYPAPALLERHGRHRTAHASLLAEIRSLVAGKTRVEPSTRPQPPLERLSDSEIRVLRYLPTNLSIPEIATELYLSPNTVKTHVGHLYSKLATHRRGEAVTRARALGLLAPAGRR